MAVSDELLFYIGTSLFVASIICFILFNVVFYIKKIKLNVQFEREYGSRLEKDGQLTDTGKRKKKGVK